MQPERSEDAALLDEALSAFVSVRPRLFGIAYRMLGSAADKSLTECLPFPYDVNGAPT